MVPPRRDGGALGGRGSRGSRLSVISFTDSLLSVRCDTPGVGSEVFRRLVERSPGTT